MCKVGGGHPFVPLFSKPGVYKEKMNKTVKELDIRLYIKKTTPYYGGVKTKVHLLEKSNAEDLYKDDSDKKYIKRYMNR